MQQHNKYNGKRIEPKTKKTKKIKIIEKRRRKNTKTVKTKNYACKI